MFRKTYTPCHEERRCYYEEYLFNKELDRHIKCCRVLDMKNPYESGKCRFFKATKNNYSGSYDGESYSPEMMKKIDENERIYKTAHGIIGRKGGRINDE